MIALRTCKKCGVEATKEEQLSLFINHKNCKHGKANICKSCNAKLYCKNIELIGSRNKKGTFSSKREQAIFLKYKLLPNEYKEIVKAQKNKCKICGCSPSNKRNGGHKHLAIDHCHTTKKVRGLLCMRCNTALGNMEDNIKLIKKMIEYLK